MLATSARLCPSKSCRRTASACAGLIAARIPCRRPTSDRASRRPEVSGYTGSSRWAEEAVCVLNTRRSRILALSESIATLVAIAAAQVVRLQPDANRRDTRVRTIRSNVVCWIPDHLGSGGEGDSDPGPEQGTTTRACLDLERPCSDIVGDCGEESESFPGSRVQTHRDLPLLSIQHPPRRQHRDGSGHPIVGPRVGLQTGRPSRYSLRRASRGPRGFI
jgi:hypothetical protein